MSYKTGYVIIALGAAFFLGAAVKNFKFRNEIINHLFQREEFSDEYFEVSEPSSIPSNEADLINPYGSQILGVKKLKGWKLEAERERQMLETAKEIIQDFR